MNKLLDLIFQELSLDDWAKLFEYPELRPILCIQMDEREERVRHLFFSGNTMDWAASSGYFSLVQWLHENRDKAKCSTYAMDGAAGKGRLDILKWLKENRTEGCTRDALINAIIFNHLDVVKWLHETYPDIRYIPFAMTMAVKDNYLDMVQWLAENRTEGCTSEALDYAVRNDNLEMVICLCEHNLIPGVFIGDIGLGSRTPRITAYLSSKYDIEDY